MSLTLKETELKERIFREINRKLMIDPNREKTRSRDNCALGGEPNANTD
jgi:hypothetical protein